MHTLVFIIGRNKIYKEMYYISVDCVRIVNATYNTRVLHALKYFRSFRLSSVTRKVEITYIRPEERREKITLRESRSGAFDCSLLALGCRFTKGASVIPPRCYGSLSSYKICVCKGASCVLSRARSRPVSEESFYGKCIRTFESFLSNLLSDRSMLFSLSFFFFSLSQQCRCTTLCNSIQIEQINLHAAEKIERCTIENFNHCPREKNL